MRLMVQNPPLGGGVWAGGRWLSGRPGALLPGAAGEAAGWAVARRVVAGVRGGAWPGWPSLVAVGAVVGVVSGGIAALGVRHAGDTP